MIFPTAPLRIDFEYCLSFLEKKIKKWTIKSVFKDSRYRIRFNAICDCGRKSTPIAYRLFKGLSSQCVSCGATRHGYFRSPTWNSWSGAKNRCLNKNNKDYEYYGGRGISFYEGWNNFEDFLKDMGEKPKRMTLDRINNNGNYEPGNCRWATYSQQNYNQRKRNGVKI